MFAAALLAATSTLTACPGPRHPKDSGATPATIEIGRDGAALRAVAGDATTLYAAVSSADGSTIEARRGQAVAWAAKLGGTVGSLALGRSLFTSLTGTGTSLNVRGEPGSVVAALDPTTGAPRWATPVESSEWATVSSLAALRDGGVLAGGTFSGTLRIGASVVSSAGKSDGFVVRLDPAGKPAWLVRVGGPHADAVQGVATREDRIAIAGTFAAGAELRGVLLPAFDERTPFADGFVAELDPKGARKWAASFGGKRDDAVAGVAIDAGGRVAVAGTVRETAHVGGAELVAQGDADGVVGWWSPGGASLHAVLIGGGDFDGLRAITAVGDRIIVAGFFSGAMRLGDRQVAAGGGDDAFVAAFDTGGAILDSWQVGGPGREEVTSLATVPGGFIAGVAHTAAANIAGAELPAHSDPMSGAAIIVRPVN